MGLDYYLQCDNCSKVAPNDESNRFEFHPETIVKFLEQHFYCEKEGTLERGKFSIISNEMIWDNDFEFDYVL